MYVNRGNGCFGLAAGSGGCFIFFFQAEAGIRDHCVTGVQTCALPISPPSPPPQAGEGADRACATMKFTLAWLKEHLETDEPLDKIVDKLTMIGLEVESVADKGKVLAPFTIARVISAQPHPNAARLRVCMVDTRAGDPVQVVSVAPN